VAHNNTHTHTETQVKMANPTKPLASNLVQIVQSAMCRSRVGIHRPAPSLFFYPGLNSMALYPENHFSFEKVLREHTSVIREEFNALRTTEKSDYDTTNDHHKLHDGKWDWNSYILKGKRNANFAAKCPRTVEILESLPLMVGTPFSYTFFSSLGPKSSIKAHFGPCNLRLRCHLPLIVPEGDCMLAVGGNKLKWEVGKPVIFDDCYEHEGTKFAENVQWEL
jgi:aspartyl/asparaginyl beta-hydroxylase (cupin superfamily)